MMAQLLALAKACDTNQYTLVKRLFSEQNLPGLHDHVSTRLLETANEYVCHSSTCLNIASQYSCADLLELLLQRNTVGSLQDIVDSNKDTLLHSSCRSQIDVHRKVALLLNVEKGLINKANKTHLTVLHMVATTNDLTLCDILLKAGADVGALSNKMLTPLHIACYFGRKSIVRLLLKHPHIELNIQDMNGDTPLHHCSSKGHLSVANMVRQHPNCLTYLTNNKGHTADQENLVNKRLLVEALEGSARSVETTICYGAICISDENNETPMMKACKSPKQPLEKVILLYNLEPNQLFMKNKAGYMPIHLAVLRNDHRLLDFFLEKGCISYETTAKRTALAVAAHFGLESMVNYLLNQPDCNINAQDTNGDTAAHLAARRNHDVILLAIEKHRRYRPRILNKSGKTADDIKHDILSSAFKRICLHAPIDAVCKMLFAGTRLIPDSSENTDLHLACTSKRDTLLKCKVILETDPQLINAQNDDGDVALHLACRNNDVELVRFLLLHPGIDANIRNKKNDWTPLHECIVPDYVDVVEALVASKHVDLNVLGNGYTACHLAGSFRRRAILTSIQSQSRFQCNTQNKGHGETVAQMWSTYGTLSDLTKHSNWIRHKSTERIDNKYWSTWALINGLLFCCHKDIYIYDMDLEPVGHISAKDMEIVRQVSQLTDCDLIAAAATGLFKLSYKGDKRGLVSPGNYASVMSHNNRVYASRVVTCDIEIYGHSGDTWWGLRRIQTQMENDYIRIWINHSSIFASSYYNDTIYIYNHDGSLKGRHGGYGVRGEAGRLRYPLMCHGDDDGDVLIADRLNGRLQVLHGDGRFSVVNMNATSGPESAVYIPGRLYISENESLISVYLPEKLNVDNPVQIQDLFR